jgi:hypothetical protein
MSTYSTPSMKTVATAGLQVATFITMIVINYVATAESTGAVAYTNLAIAKCARPRAEHARRSQA